MQTELAAPAMRTRVCWSAVVRWLSTSCRTVHRRCGLDYCVPDVGQRGERVAAVLGGRSTQPRYPKRLTTLDSRESGPLVR